jgi:hypothetical protein
MNEYSLHDLMESIDAIATAIRRSEQAILSFSPGVSPHTLLNRRVRALQIAGSLLADEADGLQTSDVEDDELRNAVAPLTSLLCKSEKALSKLAPKTWQATMLEGQIKAIRIALPLLTQALDHSKGGSASKPAAEG